MVGRRLVLGSVLAGTLLAGGLLFGEQQPSPSKSKVILPRYWSKLGLSDEQKKKASAIVTEYREKIDALRRDISKLEDEERRELNKILTDTQKEELKKLIASKAGLGEASPEEKATKPKEEKKPGGK